MKRLIAHPSFPLVMGGCAILAAVVIMLGTYFLPGLFDAQAAGQKVKSAAQQTVAAVLPEQKVEGPSTLASGSYVLEVRNQYLKEGRSFIEADLTNMQLKYYEAGRPVLDVPIKTKGREGSWWETPVGVYSVKLKEEDHFSSIGHVHQPWSLVFQGNFFIHGWPYYPDGTPVSTQYSGGCIRLADENAKMLYDMVETGTPVLVYKASKEAAPLAEFAGNPDVDGSYAILDVPTGTTVRSSDAGGQIPAGSAVNLMTALTAVDYINVESRVSVDPSVSPRFAGLDRVSVLDLLRLLLSEGDLGAAKSIANARSEAAFIRYMNAKAASIGMAHTSFVSVDSADAGNVTTVGDIALLVRYLEENRSFVLRLSKDSRGNLAYDPPIWSDLRFDEQLLALPGFYGGVNGGIAAASLTLSMNGEKRDVVIVASSLAGIREAAAWLQR